MSEVRKEKPYNRVVIIGNGFDMALGMESSYNQFLLAHIKVAYKSCIGKESFKSELFELTSIARLDRKDFDKARENVDIHSSIEELTGAFKHLFKIKGRNHYIDSLLKESLNDWVDIESFYFRKLKNLESIYAKNLNLDNTQINLLNETIDSISTSLIRYLKSRRQSIKSNNNKKMQILISDCFEHSDLRNINIKTPDNKPEHVLFLNFNYTNTVMPFLKGVDVEKYTMINIHGKIDDDRNPIIFGYGDDTSEEYGLIEQNGKDELLEKIKSIHYATTPNYHVLLNFIEALNYDVFIVGHSCGLSDKTMLKTIFENSNCITIKGFYRSGLKSDIKKRIAISRHFTDKGRFRKLYKSYDGTGFIPQFDN